MERRQRKAASNEHRNPATSSADNSFSLQSAAISSPVRDMAVIGALRAAVLASGLNFEEKNSAQDLLVKMLKQREPSLLSPDDGSALALGSGGISSSSGGKRSESLSHKHNFVGRDMSNDPYLDALRDRRKVPLACGSLRQNLISDTAIMQTRIDKLAAITIGDVVRYNEHVGRGEQRHVMAAVVAVASQRTRDENINLKLQVRRLYGYHELLRIFDSLASYRRNPKITALSYNVLKGEESADIPNDDNDLREARSAFKATEETVKIFFNGFNGLYHKVEVVALSDFETYISADQVHAVMHLTLHPDVLENVGPSPESDWPQFSECREMLHVNTVVWKSFVNTNTWTLHHIKLSTASMQLVFSAVARAMCWTPQAVTWGLTCGFRRYIRDRLTRLGQDNAQSRQAVLSVPCSFPLFAYLVMSTRSPGYTEIPDADFHVEWRPELKTWLATYQSPSLLDSHLGRHWGSIRLQEGRYIIVEGAVLMRYKHTKPGKVTFTMRRVVFGVPGGMTATLEPGEDDSAEDD